MKNNLLFSRKFIYLFVLFFCSTSYAQIKAPVIPAQNKTFAANWSQNSESLPGNIKAFEENKGQYSNPFSDEKVLFGCLRDGLTVLFTEKGIIYSMKEAVEKKHRDADKEFENQEEEMEENEKNMEIKYHQLSISWKNSNPHPRIEPIEETSFYFAADGADHIKGYKKLLYHDVYPGIDVEFKFHEGRGIEYSLFVKQGIDPSVFTLQYNGQKGLRLDDAGDLHIKTFLGDFIDHAPVSFQNGKEIASSFQKLNNEEVNFKLGAIDPTAELVIDPWLVSPITGGFAPVNVGVDASDNVYVFGAYSPASWDIRQYVQKYSSGGALLWTYYISQWQGGNGDYWIADFVVNPAGTSYIAAYYQNRKCPGSQWGMISLNTAGALNYNYCGNGTNSGFVSETWNLAYSCNYGTLIQGGTYNKPLNTAQAAIANPATGALGASSFNILKGEIYAGTVAPNGNYYVLAADSNKTWTTSSYTAYTGANSNYLGCYQLTGSTITELWWRKVNYSCTDFNPKMPLSLGTNGIGAGCKYLYTTDGIKLDQRDLTTGALIKSINIPGGSSTNPNVNSGIAVDLLCGYVYAGSKGFVYIYDENLNSAGSLSLGAANIAFDVKYNNGLISVSGATSSTTSTVGTGFVAQFKALTCPLTLNITHTNANICGTLGTATANPTFCVAPYTYLWTPTGQTTQTATGLNPGTYTVNVSTMGNCATVTDTVTIFTQNVCGITVTTTPATICSGTCGTISATGAAGTAPYTYAWSPATGLSVTTGASISACPTVTTTYTVIATDNTAKTASAIAIVTVNATPTVTSTGATLCSGTSATLTAAGATTYAWSPATGLSATTGATVTANLTTTTTYTIVGTTGSCSNSTSVVVTVNPKPVVSVTGATICPGASATLTASGATTYTWAPAAGISATTGTSVTTTATVTTTYTVTGTSLGCTGSTTVVVTVLPPCGPVVSATGVTVCNGVCGSVTSTAGGGTPPYSYLWNTGATTSGFTPSPCPTITTTYTVTVSDNSVPVGTATATAVITVNPNPVVTVPPAVICNGASATLTASGATTYTWVPATGLNSSTGTTVTANPSATTTYTVTGSFATGCTGTTTVVVTVNPIPVVAVPNASICPGGSTPLTATGAITYTWTPTLGLSSGSGTTVIANPAVTSTYTVVGTGTGGCTASTTVVVSVGALVATVSPNVTICFGASTQLSAGGGSVYSWTPATDLDNPNIANPIASPTVTTTYTVVVSDVSCSDDAVVVVTVNPPITLTIAGFPPKCAGGTDGQAVVIPAGGTSPYTYSWAPVASTMASVNGPAGTYTVIVTDQAGCTSSTSTVVIDPTPVTGTTSVITANCNQANGSASGTGVGGTGPYTYSWNTSPVQNTQTATAISAGTYVVTIKDANGCSTTASAVVPNAPGVVASIPSSTNVSCGGGNDGSATALATGGTAAYTYNWIPSGGNAVTASGLMAGSYTVTIIDSKGCSSTASVVITQPTPVVVTSSNANICPNASVTLNTSGSGGTGPYTYNWNPGALTGPSVSVSPAVTTTYTITGTDNKNCTGATTVVVTVQPAPVIVAPAATICEGTSVMLTASGATTYSWSPVTGLSDPAIANPMANPAATTSYTVVGTSAFGCTGSVEVIVTVNSKPVLSSISGNACPGDSIRLSVSGAATYSWSPSTALNSSTGPNVIARPAHTTVYTITATGANGCTSTITATATVNPKPAANFSTSPDVVDMFDPTVYFNDHSTGGIISSWKWSLGDPKNTTSVIQNPFFRYPDTTGKYQVQLIVTNQFGCIDTVTGTVIIHGIFTFYIPNTFTPNNDGTNDGFMPKGTGIDETDYDLWVFDRWGNLIWHTETWGEAWDGKANHGAEVAQIDTYVWKVHVREKDSGIKHNYIGHVNIVK